MTKVKIVQIAVARATGSINGSEARELYLDDKGRVWYEVSIPDEDKCKYNEVGRLIKAIYKNVWQQLDLPEEPEV